MSSRVSPLMIPKKLSPQLSTFMGMPSASRIDVVKQLWAYIKQENLQKPSDRRQIVNDETLKSIFEVPEMSMFEMNKKLSAHIFSDKEKPKD